MNYAKDEVAGSGVFNDKAKRNNIINTVDILVIFSKFFMEGINRFNAAVAAVFDMFFLEGLFDGFLGSFELFVGFFKAIGGEVFELFVAFWIYVHEASFFDFDADAAHL